MSMLAAVTRLEARARAADTVEELRSVVLELLKLFEDHRHVGSAGYNTFTTDGPS